MGRGEGGGCEWDEVLVVEDSLVSRKRVVKFLNRIGYGVVESAEDGLLGLEKVQDVMFRREKKYDMILTDKEMPNMDGYELTVALREMGVSCPIVGITANAMDEQIQEFMSKGVDRVMRKPMRK